MVKLPKELEKLLDGDKPDKYPTSFYLPRDLAAEFKAKCAEDGHKPSQVVAALLRWYLTATK